MGRSAKLLTPLDCCCVLSVRILAGTRDAPESAPACVLEPAYFSRGEHDRFIRNIFAIITDLQILSKYYAGRMVAKGVYRPIHIRAVTEMSIRRRS